MSGNTLLAGLVVVAGPAIAGRGTALANFLDATGFLGLTVREDDPVLFVFASVLASERLEAASIFVCVVISGRSDVKVETG